MINFLREIFFLTDRRIVKNGMRHGFRVKLWKWEYDTCLCEDRELFIVMPGTRK